VRQPLATIRLHADSFLASTPMARRIKSQENVICRGAKREPERLGPLKARALYNLYYAAGVGAFRARRNGEARGYFGKAWRQQRLAITALSYLALCAMNGQIAEAIVKAKRRTAGKR